MPTYAYRCESCGFEFEKFQGITASPLRKCSACKKLKLRRLIGTGAGILFKGSGFYETDYRSKDYQDAAKKDKPSSCTDSKKKGKGSSDKSSKETSTDKTAASKESKKSA